MKPNKTSLFRDYETLKKFVEADDHNIKKVAPKVTLELRDDNNVIQATYLYKNMTRYWVMAFDPTRININVRVPFSCRDEVAEFVNSVLSQFGLRVTRVVFGPKTERNKWIIKRLDKPQFGPESDFAATFSRSDDVFIMNWNGRIENGFRLPDWEIQRRVRSNKARARVARERFAAAKELGFIDATKLWGYKLPKDRSPENLAALNEIAKGIGYHHVAEAWAYGLNLTLDSSEHDMARSGMARLYGEYVRDETGDEPFLKLDTEKRYRHGTFD